MGGIGCGFFRRIVLRLTSPRTRNARVTTSAFSITMIGCHALLLFAAVSSVSGQTTGESVTRDTSSARNSDVSAGPRTSLWRQRQLAASESFGLDALPRVGNGYLWSFQHVISDSRNSTILVSSVASNERVQLPFWISGASVIRIEDVAVTPGHTVLIAGTFERSSDPSERHFVTEMDLSGKTLATFDLGEYEPERVCGTQDGTVWTLGQIWSSENSGGSYSLLRHYSVSGELVRSYVERRDLPAKALDLGGRFRQTGPPLVPGRTFLRCGEDTVGVYIGPALTWIQVGTGDGEAKMSRVSPPSPTVAMSGLALLGSTVYASFRGVIPGDSTKALYMLKFSPGGKSIWDLVRVKNASDKATGFQRLVGSDGPSLVELVGQPRGLKGSNLLVWIRP